MWDLLEGVSPVENIQTTDEQPLWLHHCENCLACFNWCSNQAFRGGVASKGYYQHPDIKITDIVGQISRGGLERLTLMAH